jgi:hypothetical protein
VSLRSIQARKFKRDMGHLLGFDDERASKTGEQAMTEQNRRSGSWIRTRSRPQSKPIGLGRIEVAASYATSGCIGAHDEDRTRPLPARQAGPVTSWVRARLLNWWDRKESNLQPSA